MYELIVTTNGRPSEEGIERAKQLAKEWGVPYEARRKRSIRTLHETWACDVYVVGKEEEQFYPLGASEPFTFHPSMSLVRYKRMKRGGEDPLVALGSLREGDTFVDCTLGRGSDSIIASVAVGESGRVLAFEKVKPIARIVREGMKTYESNDSTFERAVKQVEVKNVEAVDGLRQLSDRSVDVVYLDPMFEASIDEATPFFDVKRAAAYDPVTDEWIDEAKRVARRAVIWKVHYKSDAPERYGFTRIRRQTSKFHYTVWTTKKART